MTRFVLRVLQHCLRSVLYVAYVVDSVFQFLLLINVWLVVRGSNRALT